MYSCGCNHISKHRSKKMAARNQLQNSTDLIKYFSTLEQQPTSWPFHQLQKSIQSSMYHASRKWWGTIAKFKPVYSNWMRKVHSGSNLNRSSILVKDICAPPDQGSPHQVERHLSRRCDLGTSHYSLIASTAAAFRKRMLLMAKGMLGSNHNPFIYVINLIGSRHSHSQLKSQ